MNMEQRDKEKINKIISGFQCPKGFKCYKSGFENVCKAKDVGMETFLICLEDDPKGCVFAIPYGRGHFCHCPLRIYIAKELKK